MAETVTTGSRFVWHELMATNPEASHEFFTKLLGWTIEDRAMGETGTYSMIQAGGAGIGGVVPLAPSQGMPSHWIAYVSVDEVDSVAARAEAQGGKVIVEPQDIPDVGRFAVIADPCGAHCAPFQGKAEAPPEPEGPPAPGTFCWHELLTNDIKGSADFYSAIFGWTSAEFDMGEMGMYNIFRRDDKDTAGMMQMPADAEHPPFWLPYVAVEDVDTSTAKVKELGGHVWAEPQDIPDVGRFSVCADPTGATFALFKGMVG